MMRAPTDPRALYAWHTAALRGDRPDTQEGEPQCGWYRRRLVKGGPWVPARIWMHQPIDPATGLLDGPEEFRCRVRGEPADPHREWLWLASNPISKAQHDAMVAEIDRAGREDPTNPILFPHQPINLSRSPSCPHR